MFLPSTDGLCPARLFPRDFGLDVKSTAQSFKSWDTCMDNKTCKIVAIVGIVLAALFIFWILATVVQCLCMGASCIEALCCCCCRSVNRKPRYEEKQAPYANPNMYPPAPAMHYTRAPQPAYQPLNNTGDHSHLPFPPMEPASGYHVSDRHSYQGGGPFHDDNRLSFPQRN